MGDTGSCYFMFLHCFKKSGLCLRRSPVYLIRKNNVGKYGTFNKTERSLFASLIFFNNFSACNITRH